MKKIEIATIITFILLIPLALIQAQQGTNSSKSNNANQNNKELLEPIKQQDRERLQDMIDEPDQVRDRLQEQDWLYEQDRNRIHLSTSEELETIINNHQQQLRLEQSELSDRERNLAQNQNQMRIATNALLYANDFTGDGIGSYISQFAQEINDSLPQTIQAEKKIQSRSSFRKFFFGGDDDAVDVIDSEISRNRNRIGNMYQLVSECDCEKSIRNMFQQQIQNMETEQNRLEQLANMERQKKGIFGFLF